MIETCITGDELTESRFISAQASRKNEKDDDTHRFHFGYGGFHTMNTFMKVIIIIRFFIIQILVISLTFLLLQFYYANPVSCKNSTLLLLFNIHPISMSRYPLVPKIS